MATPAATASAKVPDFGQGSDAAARWLADYAAVAGPGDVIAAHAADGAWQATFAALATLSGGDFAQARDRVQRTAEDIGTGFRLAGETEERPWPLSPVPLLLAESDWALIAAAIAQRATLLEAIAADIHGPARLVNEGHLPAALVTGSPWFLRPLAGLTPPGGYHLHFVAMDIGRTPDGQWQVLADHTRAPAGAGYALENRLAMARTMGALQAQLNIARHAPFFAAFRAGLAAVCRRVEPRIGLLTPGRMSASYAEQAHLARYLGLLLVEGADLAVLEDKLYVRTIGGLKRVDALWHRTDPRRLDPLAFDAHAGDGIAGIVDAMAAGNVVIANAPGVGMLESPALAAFLPRIAAALGMGELLMPGLPTWWCGDPAQYAAMKAAGAPVIAPAFAAATLALPDGRPVRLDRLDEAARTGLSEDMARRPQDYVGQAEARLSTMPVVAGDALAPRPFTLRVFAARGADGAWQVLPGGLARIADAPDPHAALIGEGQWSADVIIHGGEAVAPVSLLPSTDSAHVRRNPGTLPSRVADNFYWLGRYLERGEALLGVIRVMLGNSIDADAGAVLEPATIGRLVGLVVSGGAAPHPASLGRDDLAAMARTALEAGDGGWHSVRAINRLARGIGAVSRDRLSADMVRLLDAPFPANGSLLDRAGSLQRRYAALAGLSAEHMGRTAAWRFHDLGRRVERAMAAARATRLFGMAGASADDLTSLLDLADSQISYRQRYLTGIARVPVVDLVALDPGNPRALAFQLEAINAHLRALPVLGDDGMDEPQQAQAAQIMALITAASAADMEPALLIDIERRLTALSDAIARRYFLQGAEPLRAGGLTLA